MRSADDKRKHVVIIGAGLAGLAACYDLLNAGLRVTLIESAPSLGGLAGSIKIEGQPVERFYHFICHSDSHLLKFVAELGMQNQLHWQQTRTAFYTQGRMYPFGTPFDLLSFSAVPWLQRIRFGLHIISSRYRMQWRQLDGIPARPWLIKNIGEEAYNVIWHPLLQIKFGGYYDRISAAWAWHRIWRVAKSRQRLWEHESFGYLENGSATLVEHLTDYISTHPQAKMLPGTNVVNIDNENGCVIGVNTSRGILGCDALISTVALPVLDRLLPGQSEPYFEKTRQIDYIGVVCVLFSLKHPFSYNFWTNINDPRICFNGIIEQTNLNRNLHSSGLNLLYVPFYLPADQPRYHQTDHALISEIIPMLRLMNPGFNENWIKEFSISRNPFAQAICTTGFVERMPVIRSHISGLYVTDSTQFYPEDRTISAAIRQGRRAAYEVLEDFHAAG